MNSVAGEGQDLDAADELAAKDPPIWSPVRSPAWPSVSRPDGVICVRLYIAGSAGRYPTLRIECACVRACPCRGTRGHLGCRYPGCGPAVLPANQAGYPARGAGWPRPSASRSAPAVDSPAPGTRSAPAPAAGRTRSPDKSARWPGTARGRCRCGPAAARIRRQALTLRSSAWCAVPVLPCPGGTAPACVTGTLAENAPASVGWLKPGLCCIGSRNAAKEK